jgi:hypothetical protein
VPTYGKDRVRSLIRHLHPTGNLLLLRTRTTDGECIATGVSFGMHRRGYFWGNGSWRQHQHLYPNEPLHWYAMRHWKRRGATCYDLCGAGQYKEKYGARSFETYLLQKSRFGWISLARTVAEKSYHCRQNLAGLFHHKSESEKKETDT